MSNFIDLNSTIEHNKLSNFCQYLVETAHEMPDFEPPNFCLIAPGYLKSGFGDNREIRYASLDEECKESLMMYIGALHAELDRATKLLNESTYGDDL